MIRNYFPNPIQFYRDVKSQIPMLKIENQKLMNKYTSLNMSADFWWVISGETAINSQYINYIFDKDPRILNELNNSSEEKIEAKKISKILINLIGRESLNGINDTIKKNSTQESILIDDEKDRFREFSNRIDDTELDIPYNHLCKILFLLRNFKKHIISFIKFFSDRIFNKKEYLDFKSIDKKNIYEQIFISLLPKNLLFNFPSWFIFLSKLLISTKHKWITYFGLELNIFHKILIARSYEKFKGKNIKVLGHGHLMQELDNTTLFLFSLFPEINMGVSKQSLKLDLSKSIKPKKGILFCPLALPWINGYLSITDYQELIKVYRSTIKILCDGAKKGKNIKIKYKNFIWLKDYMGNFLVDEKNLPVEKKNFEEIYNEYSKVVTFPYGTITAKCIYNKIPILSYHKAIYTSDRNSFLEISKLDGIHIDADLFLKDLEKMINQMPE